MQLSPRAQILHDLARDDQTDRRRDEGVAAGNLPPLRTLARRPRRADTVRPAADGQIVERRGGRLPGVDDLQVPDAALLELPPHDPRQRTDRRLVDVRHLERGGVHLVARAHAADDGNPGAAPAR